MLNELSQRLLLGGGASVEVGATYGDDNGSSDMPAVGARLPRRVEVTTDTVGTGGGKRGEWFRVALRRGIPELEILVFVGTASWAPQRKNGAKWHCRSKDSTTSITTGTRKRTERLSGEMAMEQADSASK